MVMACAHIFVILALIPLAKMEPAFVKKLQKQTSFPNCEPYTTQLRSLLTLVCTNIAESTRDACVGCFQQATIANNNQPSLTNLRNCAENYFDDTRYQECSSQIDTDPGIGACVSGYCRFVTCLRRINADLLVAQCYREASADNDAVIEEDQVILVKNITSCILAKTRCASISPINGQQQTNQLTITTYDKWGKPKTSTVPLYNSLQVTPDGDLRIIGLPGTTKIQNYFCTTEMNLRESSWLEYSC